MGQGPAHAYGFGRELFNVQFAGEELPEGMRTIPEHGAHGEKKLRPADFPAQLHSAQHVANDGILMFGTIQRRSHVGHDLPHLGMNVREEAAQARIVLETADDFRNAVGSDQIVEEIGPPLVPETDMRRFLAVDMAKEIIPRLVRTHAQHPGGHVPAAIGHSEHADFPDQGEESPAEQVSRGSRERRVRNGDMEVERHGEVLQITYDLMRHGRMV